MRPLAIDLFTGLHGWADGLNAAGWDVIGVDIVDMSKLVGEPKPDHFWLIVQNVLTVHGSQFRKADLIVSSSPCTEYSYMAMPWTRAKAKAAAIRADETGEALRKLNELYDAQFRIQREASEAAGRYIPMVVENVRGAIPWVGRSKANFGSYHLWGDVPALMPTPSSGNAGGWGGVRSKTHAGEQWNINRANFTGTLGWDEDAGRKVPGFRFDGSGRSFQSESVERHVAEGRKHRDADGYERNHPAAFGWKSPRTSSGAKHARKAASAKIARIPLTLSTWIGRAWLPERANAA